ncbi:MAG: LytR C-terminal domain-containing protein [Gemmatimonadaceae bacterium]|nr:LytR C-terminal domain-containing protein [Gemmatimonadaceae bacterium]
MERRALTRAIALGVIALALLGSGWWAWHAWTRPMDASVDAVRRVVPEGTRIRVEVVNATTARGLARRATLYLRDLGFDVVRFSGSDVRRDTTLVIDRVGRPEWARLASEAFGNAPVESRADTAGFVDLTILVGSSWRAPPQTLNP